MSFATIVGLPAAPHRSDRYGRMGFLRDVPMPLSQWLLRLARHDGFGLIVNYHTLSTEETREHVDLLGRSFDFVSHDDLLLKLWAGRAARPFCFLTFDDGKKSNATEVAPALHQLGVPAAFYVCTEFLSRGGRALWFDRLSALRTRVPHLGADLRADVLKRLPSSLRDQRLDEACRRFGIDSDMANDHIRPMSWDDARALHRQGFTIGAHSEWHAILTTESPAAARIDISNSMNRLATELRTRCVTFSFPNGNYTTELAQYAHSCGAETVFTTEPMWIRPGAQPWRLPRIQLFTQHGASRLALKVLAAKLPGILRNPDGTGRRYAQVRRR